MIKNLINKLKQYNKQILLATICVAVATLSILAIFETADIDQPQATPLQCILGSVMVSVISMLSCIITWRYFQSTTKMMIVYLLRVLSALSLGYTAICYLVLIVNQFTYLGVMVQGTIAFGIWCLGLMYKLIIEMIMNEVNRVRLLIKRLRNIDKWRKGEI